MVLPFTLPDKVDAAIFGDRISTEGDILRKHLLYVCYNGRFLDASEAGQVRRALRLWLVYWRSDRMFDPIKLLCWCGMVAGARRRGFVSRFSWLNVRRRFWETLLFAVNKEPTGWLSYWDLANWMMSGGADLVFRLWWRSRLIKSKTGVADSDNVSMCLVLEAVAGLPDFAQESRALVKEARRRLSVPSDH